MKYLKLYEGRKNIKTEFHRFMSIDETKTLYTPLINWDLINDAKDMSLEYLDEGLSLYLAITNIQYIYASNFSHVECECEETWFSNESKPGGKLTYLLWVYRGSRYTGKKCIAESEELASRLMEAYPNENIINNK